MSTASKNYVIALIIAGAVLLPWGANAITSSEVDAQIKLLLEQITSLQARIQQYSTIQQSGTASTNAQGTVCPVLERTLALGVRGTDVSDLQRFLVSEGVLTQSSVTGYYDITTEQSVRRWQGTHGIVSSGSAATTGYGVVGPRTRSLIALSCVLNTKTQVLIPATATDPAPQSCPVAPPPTTTICSAGWQAVTDSYGCTTSYTCSTPLAVAGTQTGTTTTSSTASLSLISPIEGSVVSMGSQTNIAWNSRNPRGNGIRLELISADSGTLVRLLDVRPLGTTSGSYYWWNVSSGNSGNTSITPGRYKIRGAMQDSSSATCEGIVNCFTYTTGESAVFTIVQ